ncbi:MAG TPA: hypothetical protein VG388_15260 [Solirubrobacteraceae bacterium]|jgi:ABC-type glycerol-3-phosphate transport system substrate-binding protein|nr:hypothetical protein [Solirubrobacteraceae bacterium]
MRLVTRIGIAGAAALLAAGCGSGTGTFANRPRPPVPITITGSVSNTHVLISPASFGAGPITLEVTNAASRSVSLTVENSAGHAVAALQSINPDTPGVVKFDIAPGDYTVAASAPGIRPAALHVGRERPSAPRTVLEP